MSTTQHEAQFAGRYLVGLLVSGALLFSSAAFAASTDMQDLQKKPETFLGQEVEIVGVCVKGGKKGDVFGYECTTEEGIYVDTRDVEPEAGDLDDVFLYSVDDLSNIVKDNLNIRRESVAQAEGMIATQAESFLRWLEGRTVVPTISALHGHHDELRTAELERARRLLATGTPPEQALEQLARGLTNKFLHAPTQALNQAGDAERAELVAMFERMYNIPDGH